MKYGAKIEVTMANAGAANVVESSNIQIKSIPEPGQPLYIWVHSDNKLLFSEPWHLSYLAFRDYSKTIEFSKEELAFFSEYGSKRKSFFWRFRHKQLIQKIAQLGEWVGEKKT